MKSILSSLLLASLLAIVSTKSAQAQLVYSPISITNASFTGGDVIWGPAPGDETNSTTISGAWTMVSQGQGEYTAPAGLPANGQIVNTQGATSVTTFQLQPYNENNVIQSTDGTTDTLTLSTPESYTNIALLLTNSGAFGSATYTLNFSDSTTQTLFFDPSTATPNWVDDSVAPAAGGTGSIAFNEPVLGQYGGNVQLYEYDIALGANSSKTLDSITVVAASDSIPAFGATNLNTFAVSGVAVPEPSTWAMMFAGLAFLGFWGIARARFSEFI